MTSGQGGNTGVGNTGEKIQALVARLYAGLDTLSYYDFLGVPRDASAVDIQQAFYERAEILHPDRFFAAKDSGLKAQVYEVYKRIAEGYRVLGDPATRKEYDAGLAQGKVRLVRQEREGPSIKQPDEGITNPQAKRFFRLGLEALRTGDLKGAHMNFSFALSMEPNNELIRARVAELEDRLGIKKKK